MVEDAETQVDPALEYYVNETKALRHFGFLASVGLNAVIEWDKFPESAPPDSKEYVAFAKTQGEEGFPYLFSLVTVQYWSILEAMVDRLVVNRLRNPPKSTELKKLRTLKGPLIDFVNASPDEQAEFLAAELKLKVEATLKRGVGRFEAVLDALGLGGGVEKHVSKAILELSQVRNVIVHRGGVADRRFIDACPWMMKKVNEPLVLSGLDISIYHAACDWYTLEMGRRLYAQESSSPEETAKRFREIQADREKELRDLWAHRERHWRNAVGDRTVPPSTQS